jgi:hypothetical protein
MMTFEQCVRECRADAQFVDVFNRMVGVRLTLHVDHVDPLCGDSVDEKAFRTFVFDTVWSVMPEDFQRVGSLEHLTGLAVVAQ